MMSKKAVDNFSLYGSIVFATEEGSPKEVLQHENQRLQWELAKLHDEVSTWGSGTEVLAQDSRRKDRKIADLEAANDDLRDQLRTTKRELTARIDALTE